MSENKIIHKDGTVKCNECKGEGHTIKPRGASDNGFRLDDENDWVVCERCNGFGSLQWVDNILGACQTEEINGKLLDSLIEKSIANARKGII